jgi:hypothetical protein
MDAADLTWGSINAGTAKWCVIYVEGASDATSRLIAAFDLDDGGAGVVTNGGDLTASFGDDGVFYFGTT